VGTTGDAAEYQAGKAGRRAALERELAPWSGTAFSMLYPPVPWELIQVALVTDHYKADWDNMDAVAAACLLGTGGAIQSRIARVFIPMS
jgi:hypothetical protein